MILSLIFVQTLLKFLTSYDVLPSETTHGYEPWSTTTSSSNDVQRYASCGPCATSYTTGANDFKVSMTKNFTSILANRTIFNFSAFRPRQPFPPRQRPPIPGRDPNAPTVTVFVGNISERSQVSV